MEASLPHEEIDRARSEKSTPQKMEALSSENVDRPAVMQVVVGIGASAGGPAVLARMLADRILRCL